MRRPAGAADVPRAGGNVERRGHRPPADGRQTGVHRTDPLYPNGTHGCGCKDGICTTSSPPEWDPFGNWFADSFVKYGVDASGRGGSGRPQFAKDHPHRIAERAWYTFAVTVGGGSMAHFVNGVEEMRDKCGTDGVGPIPCETPIPYIPHAHGRMSIGVRINQV